MTAEGRSDTSDSESADPVGTQQVCGRSRIGDLLLKVRALSLAERFLVILFLLTLPFVTARIRWDGIGYYAYARSLIIDHNLQFKGDFNNARAEPFLLEHHGRVLVYAHVTKTGHIPNFFAVGPAMLWAPFIATVHGTILILDHFGYAIPHDGHGKPYLDAMALASALYAFAGLWLSFRLARHFVAERWALLATVTIWFASSLPVYMYSEPSWSHADSVFAVSLFLWYWLRTRNGRTRAQWFIWGAMTGLMCDVYFANGVFLLLPAIDFVLGMRKQSVERQFSVDYLAFMLPRGFAYAAAFLVAFSPTLIVRQIIFGNPLATGLYGSRRWNWTSPRFWSVLASPSHGLLTTTPVLALALLGVVLLWRRHREVGSALLWATAAFYTLIAVDPWWDGTVSFGNRFFISLTPVFILGLAVTFESFTRVYRDSGAALRRAATISALLIVWNLGLVCQVDRHMFPVIGPVDWQQVVYDQFRTVPGDLLRGIQTRIGPQVWAREIPKRH